MINVTRIVALVLGVIGILIINITIAMVISFVMAAIAMEMWNIFCPYANLPAIGYWQTWSFIVLISIIANIMKVKVTVNNN